MDDKKLEKKLTEQQKLEKRVQLLTWDTYYSLQPNQTINFNIQTILGGWYSGFYLKPITNIAANPNSVLFKINNKSRGYYLIPDLSSMFRICMSHISIPSNSFLFWLSPNTIYEFEIQNTDVIPHSFYFMLPYLEKKAVTWMDRHYYLRLIRAQGTLNPGELYQKDIQLPSSRNIFLGCLVNELNTTRALDWNLRFPNGSSLFGQNIPFDSIGYSNMWGVSNNGLWYLAANEMKLIINNRMSSIQTYDEYLAFAVENIND